jgi:hypothetical protein
MTSLLRAGLAILAFCAASAQCAADRLILPNGELLIGSLVSEDAEAYVFQSVSLGELRIRKDSGAKYERGDANVAIVEQNKPGWVSTDEALVRTPARRRPRRPQPRRQSRKRAKLRLPRPRLRLRPNLPPSGNAALRPVTRSWPEATICRGRRLTCAST